MKANRLRPVADHGANVIGLLIAVNLAFWIVFTGVLVHRWLKPPGPASQTVAAIRALTTAKP